MRVDHFLNSTLSPLVGDRFYWNTFPEGDEPPDVPAIRGSLVSSDAAATICGTGDEDHDDVRVQLDLVDHNYAPMRDLRDDVVAALAADSRWVRLGVFETYDAETRLHRSTLDYLFQQT